MAAGVGNAGHDICNATARIHDQCFLFEFTLKYSQMVPDIRDTPMQTQSITD